MHVKTKMTAYAGLFLALCVLCMALGSVIETSTLFLLAAASFFVGIVIREFGMKMGFAFYVAAVLLGFILAPNKFYVLTFAAMGLYILAYEGIWRILAKDPDKMPAKGFFWALKYIVFNVMYIPLVLFFQEFLFGRELSSVILGGILLAGQAGLWIYDGAYCYTQIHIWNKLRRHMVNADGLK